MNTAQGRQMNLSKKRKRCESRQVRWCQEYLHLIYLGIDESLGVMRTRDFKSQDHTPKSNSN